MQWQFRSIRPVLRPSTGTSAADSHHQIPPRHSTRLPQWRRRLSAGRGASSPARSTLAREIPPATPPPTRRLLPAPFPFPSHPRARENSRLPSPESISDSACALKTSKGQRRSIARHQCLPARNQTAAAPRVARQLESRTVPQAQPTPLFSMPRFFRRYSGR